METPFKKLEKIKTGAKSMYINCYVLVECSFYNNV